MVSVLYRFTAEASVIIDDRIIDIPMESISSIVINKDYDKSNRPIIYLSFSIQPSLYDDMVFNSETALVNLRIQKKDANTEWSINEDYIHDVFTYLIDTNPDYYKSIRNTDDNANTYINGTIALFKKDIIDRIKHLHNDIIKNSTQTSIIRRYTRDINLVMESLTYNATIPSIIIPPMESLTELLGFLNDFHVLYDKKYRYFEDFDTVYLLNQSGKPIHDKDEYDTVLIDILDTMDSKNKDGGIDVDTKSRVYIMNVDALYTSMNLNNTQTKEYNKIIGVSSTGDIEKLELNGNPSEDDMDKVLLRRISNDNMKYLNNIKNEINSSAVVLQITRGELDSSIITPNKEYLVNAYDKYKEYNGNFLLSYKKELLIKKGTEFISETIIGLRKVME